MAHHYSYLDPKTAAELKAVADSIPVKGKGILAVDEFPDGIAALLNAVGLEDTAENRRDYREMLFTSPGLSQYVSGVILYDETIFQKTSSGETFPQLLGKRGMIPGCKVDENTVPLAGTDGEVATQGLTNLAERAKKYKEAGCKFAKWRAVIKIGENKPSALAIQEAAWSLARYASCCQQAGLVPIVEPDVVNEGTHDLETCQKTTEKVLAAVYKALNDNHVYLEGTLLKPNMVTPGKQSAKKATAEQVADATVTTFKRTVPAAVPGILFLSGGLGEALSAAYLNAINVRKGSNAPWPLTYSYGRALQETCWKAYGKNKNVKAAQEAFLQKCKDNSLASQGLYVN